ncbi:family 43 glycosylhydrolase [Chitinophaga horti]|uniref:Family 43 glycosylhydrolase n=1 Tax=Chitinophaga horti TaxID=2920382 RepID=A0ABY6J823_9BACT|nr:family 43 glycosylhydrolase [Chitinophaga horti]UYQ95824.1 family 43 glycosylhydrolase [Chitinophaga horti]
MKKSWIYLSFLLAANLPSQAQRNAYLFTYFTGNDESVRFALSNDGYNFKALNNGQSVLDSDSISATGGVRDPHILRGTGDNKFYMVATDMHTAKNGWGPNTAIVLMRSTDLLDWRTHSIDIAKLYPQFAAADRVWAPQTIYDAAKKQYMVYWSMRLGAQDSDKIYYAYANKDFSALTTTPKVLFTPPAGTVCIDADIIPKDGKFHLFFKHAGGSKNGIKKAISNKLTEGYVFQDKTLEQTTDEVEGSGIFKLNNSNDYILMYDVYRNGRYEFARSSDLEHFSAINAAVTMDFKPRHGTVMPITDKEASALAAKWLTPQQVILSAGGAGLKPINSYLDSAANTLHLQLRPGSDVSKFKPTFGKYPGASITSVGADKYTVAIKGRKPVTFIVKATETHNAALEGFYADPDVLYAEKTGKYYIYPTSDGFDNWSGTYFKVFSSDNLVNWKDEGKILQLGTDVTWANKNAWAPCIIEKKVNGAYKYYYYFTAAQKIGVAVADHPTGPFKDSGKPLIDKRPEGIKGGQEIDPDVFMDPATGKSYLYWGNGYMAVAELQEDMISLVPGSTKIITPDRTFREGTCVFVRNGKYYFTWSENDTRDPDYRVRYGIADSPTGKIQVPANNMVLNKDAAVGLYGTGHHSILQIPGKDEWYIVYHRFNYPKGINMGRAAGYNREVCIDKMTFGKDGTIITVTPTHKGIDPLSK